MKVKLKHKFALLGPDFILRHFNLAIVSIGIIKNDLLGNEF